MAGAQTALCQVMQLREQGIDKIAAEHSQAAPTRTPARTASTTSRSAPRAVRLRRALQDLRRRRTSPRRSTPRASRSAAAGGAADQPRSDPAPTWAGCSRPSSRTRSARQHSTTAANANNDRPGLHGHSLNYVSVDGTQLSPTGNQHDPGEHSADVHVLNLTNGGNFNEYAGRVLGLDRRSQRHGHLDDPRDHRRPDDDLHRDSCPRRRPPAPTR